MPLNEKNRPTYDELAQKVKEYEIQEKVFKSVIKQLESVYSDLAANQTEFERKSAQLEEKRSRMNAILENMTDGIVLINRFGKVTHVNTPFFSFFNKDDKNIINKNISEVIDNPNVHDAIAEMMNNPGEKLRRRAELENGVYLKIIMSPISVDNFLEGFVFSFRDVSTEVAVDKMKTDFISSVSHELRTPLTSVIGFAKMMEKRLYKLLLPQIEVKNRKIDDAKELVRESLDIIISESERMTDLINDVLDIAKMEAGSVEWRMEPLSINEIVEKSCLATSSFFEQGDVKFVKKYEDGLPNVTGDKNRLMQVVINLISNAAKFTHTGTVTCKTCGGDGKIVVRVIDTGIGIPENKLGVVFEKFKQAHDTLDDMPSGTGLGLSICKQIVEHHGGKIWVESQAGKGSVFSFNIPILNKPEK